MPKDPQFEKKDFDRIIANLLNSPPLRKKDLKTSRRDKVKRVIPVRRQPKSARGGGV
jgi:hypothetical protein